MGRDHREGNDEDAFSGKKKKRHRLVEEGRNIYNVKEVRNSSGISQDDGFINRREKWWENGREEDINSTSATFNTWWVSSIPKEYGA